MFAIQTDPVTFVSEFRSSSLPRIQDRKHRSIAGFPSKCLKLPEVAAQCKLAIVEHQSGGHTVLVEIERRLIFRRVALALGCRIIADETGQAGRPDRMDASGLETSRWFVPGSLRLPMKVMARNSFAPSEPS